MCKCLQPCMQESFTQALVSCILLSRVEGLNMSTCGLQQQGLGTRGSNTYLQSKKARGAKQGFRWNSAALLATAPTRALVPSVSLLW